MVPTSQVRVLPHHLRSAIFFSGKLRLKFLCRSFVASLSNLASANVGTWCSKVPSVRVKCSTTFGHRKRVDWSIKSSADGKGPDPLTNSGDGRTRLIKILQNLQIRVKTRIQDLRKDFPKKFLCFLVGFYCATAFATVIGQTGDWDILSAGLAVVVVECIGALMYKASVPLLERARNVIVFFNYWKAGLTLGLFLDSFKY